MSRARTATLLLALAAAPAGAAHVELLSESVLPSDTASGGSRAAAISGEGRYVAYTSDAVNAVQGLTNRRPGVQLFLYDRATNLSTLISHRAGAPEEAGNNASGDQVSISANGRFVAFTSEASDLVPGVTDANGTTDVYLWDRVTGTTALVSRQAGSRTTAATGMSLSPAVSANGRFVAFESLAPDLVDLEDQPPFHPASDVYVWDRRTGEVLPVSRSASEPGRMADGPSSAPSISANGRFVAFLSEAPDLAAGQIERNTGPDVFLWDRVTRASVLVSHAARNPLATGNSGESVRARISADGRFVAFTSAATDLVARQRSTGGPDAFLWSRETGAIALVSHRHNSAVTGAGVDPNATPYVSADGNWVAYASEARNLVRNPGDPNLTLDVFLWSRATGRNTLVSRPDVGSTGSVPFGLSADGAWAGYVSSGLNQVRGVADTNSARNDLFLFERRTGKIRLVSFSNLSPHRTANDQSQGALLSTDGGWIAWTTPASDLLDGVRDGNRTTDAVLQSRDGEREIVTLHAEDRASATPQGVSLTRSIDASGRFVLFTSTADAGLLVPGVRDVNSVEDLFLYDRQLDEIELITRSAANPEATADSEIGGSLEGRISAGGRWVVFASNAKDVVAGVSRALTNKVYLWDRTTGRTVWVAGLLFSAHDVAISADGGAVAFRSFEPTLVPGQVDHGIDPTSDVFVWERASGTITLVSRANGSAIVTANGHSVRPLLSADGRIVAYTSEATNLLATGTTAEGQDVFLFDRQTGTATLASGAVAPPATVFGRFGHDLSGDGRFVLFESHTENEGAGETFDLYLYDRIASTTTLVTHTAGSPTAPAASSVGTDTATLSADGRFAAFRSLAGNLLPTGETPSGPNVFVFDRETGAIELISRAVRTVPAAPGGNRAGSPVISADGRRVAFLSNRLDLAPGLTGQQTGVNLFVHDRVTRTATLVSHSFEDPNRMSDGSCGLHVSSSNGTATAFSCSSTDLVPGDFNRFGGPQPDAFAANVP